MQRRKNSPFRGKWDAEFGFDLTPDIIDGENTFRHDRWQVSERKGCAEEGPREAELEKGEKEG